MAKKSSPGKKLKDFSESRKYFGAFNDPRLKEESNLASSYVQEHTNIVSREAVREAYMSQAEKARLSLDSELGMSDKDFLKMMEILGKAQKAFSPKIAEFKQTYATSKGLLATANAIKEGAIKEQDISRAIDDFQTVVYNLMNAVVIGAGFEGIDLSGINSKADIAPGDLQKLLSGKESVYTWLKGDAQGAATSVKNLFDNYDSFVKAYEKGEQNSTVWVNTSPIKKTMDEKSAGSIYNSTRKALQAVQGGIGEKVMAMEIANQMREIEYMLGELVGVKGSETTNTGRFGKGDISVPFRKESGNIVNVNVSVKAKIVDKKSKVSFEGGSGDTKSYFNRYGYSSLYEPYTVLSHYRNINGRLSGMNTTLYSISAIVGAAHALEAFGSTQKTHFLAFSNKVVPTYKLLEEMGSGGYELHIGANDDKYMKYDGKFNQSIAYQEYVDFKGSGQPSWNTYKSYIEQKSNTTKKTQFVLAYRK